ncbi:hypothetical protein RJ639_022440 [Escallonia herrerae]|uniref:WIBG Mago-binding domain-containing protein n=1 Tax=Escallonia herrerae TaxID=1293975 RepID=A0AA89AFE6_9ASTE|nr:hypothetical protein RJ639_022440 [Escallonia herrerae]
MASSVNGREEEVKELAAQLGKTLKEGERIVAPTRRPDGTLRKPIRIRAGYVPQDEVAIYQSKGALWRKEMESQEVVPPGYDPVLDAKPKTKSAKRNERKKEKRLQHAKDLEKSEVSSGEEVNQGLDPVESVASQINELSVSTNSSVVNPPSDSPVGLTSEDHAPDVDKRIRALKKKIRLMEAQQQKSVQDNMKQEQLEKLAKLEGWRQELKLLEDKKAGLATS